MDLQFMQGLVCVIRGRDGDRNEIKVMLGRMASATNGAMALKTF